ncbi:MAG: DnaA/Hda family protein, partial [Alphaproteobacteria bacterium]|nr:DnaA/Hda family protein [Alphaproteobacteria bacterium]
ENTQKYFVLDDADLIKDDILLFYIYNTIKEKNAYLLMTSVDFPNKWDLKFNDIKSRLSTLNIIRIQKPNELVIISIIEKMLLQRGIIAKENVIEYIANRIERSYESMNYWINRLDSLLIDKKSGLSIKIVKEIIN